MSVPMLVEYHGVRFWPGRVELIGVNTPVLTLHKEEILRITVGRGYQSERPLLQTVAGLLLLLIPLGMLIDWATFLQNRIILVSSRGTAIAIVLTLLGLYLLLNALKRGPMLLVEMQNDRRKLPFHGSVQKGDLTNFLRNAIQLGYAIDLKGINDL